MEVLPILAAEPQTLQTAAGCELGHLEMEQLPLYKIQRIPIPQQELTMLV